MSYFIKEDVQIYDEGGTPTDADTYKGVHVSRMTLSTDITSHAVEDVEVSDHLTLKPPSFYLELALYDDLSQTNPGMILDSPETLGERSRSKKLEKLRSRWLSRTPLSLKCSFGVFHDMFIGTLNIEEYEGSVSSYRVTLTLQMVVTADIEEITITYIVDKDGAIAGISATEIDFTQIGLTTPEKVSSEDRSLLEKLWDWLGF